MSIKQENLIRWAKTILKYLGTINLFFLTLYVIVGLPPFVQLLLGILNVCVFWSLFWVTLTSF